MNVILLSVAAISLIILVLAYVIRHSSVREGSVKTKNLVAVSIGIMLTVLITHLLPEVYLRGIELDVESYFGMTLEVMVFLVSLLGFYILGWIYHDHEHENEHEKHEESPKSSAYSMFIGQSIHSVADGAVIASSFSISVWMGAVISFAISMHHIPMMSGAIMRHVNNSNYNKLFLYTLLSSSTMMIGVMAFYFARVSELSTLLISVSAASFLYVGGYDLASYLREYEDNKILRRLLFLILGVFIGLISNALLTI